MPRRKAAGSGVSGSAARRERRAAPLPGRRRTKERRNAGAWRERGARPAPLDRRTAEPPGGGGSPGGGKCGGVEAGGLLQPVGSVSPGAGALLPAGLAGQLGEEAAAVSWSRRLVLLPGLGAVLLGSSQPRRAPGQVRRSAGRLPERGHPLRSGVAAWISKHRNSGD